MIVIRKKKSKDGSKQVIVTIRVCEDATPGSWGSHQLLIDEYRRMDDEWTKLPNGMRTDLYEQVMFNTAWLLYMEKKYGPLHCEYCGQPNLKIFQWYEKQDLEIIATTDHFYPKSKFPEFAKDYKNLVVSCHTHNTNKKSKVVDPSELKFPYPEERIF